MKVDRLLEGTSLEHIRLGSHQSVCDVIERAWSPSLCSVRPEEVGHCPIHNEGIF